MVAQQAFGFPTAGCARGADSAHVLTLLLSGFFYVREFTQRALAVARA